MTLNVNIWLYSKIIINFLCVCLLRTDKTIINYITINK